MIRLSPKDVQWAIAAATPPVILERLARDLPRELRSKKGSRVVTGNAGFSALLVFGDHPDERLAKLLLQHATPAYLLDFDENAPRTIRLERRVKTTRERRLRIHPADFLEARGIVAPGYSLPPSPVKAVGVLEGATIEEAHRAIPKSNIEFRAHPMGILVVDTSGISTSFLAQKTARTAYVLFYNTSSGEFSCSVYKAGAPAGEFAPGYRQTSRERLDHVLGETTLDGILKALSIPAELIGYKSHQMLARTPDAE